MAEWRAEQLRLFDGTERVSRPQTCTHACLQSVLYLYTHTVHLYCAVHSRNMPKGWCTLYTYLWIVKHAVNAVSYVATSVPPPSRLADRSVNDIIQYPVFPWVIADYESEELGEKALMWYMLHG